ncbi:hypothetical protein [Brevibacterium sp. S111]|uniref:hypothetical protein n=1 Tax=Brevibacterium sp. S111 TaxID=2483795 RepID=UPI001080CDC9|nr:hypothetical protein [Brevibacterium sp. S111]TGD08335.1 hypothetical protein EB836_17715 [Brevibacterium sp. S111]
MRIKFEWTLDRAPWQSHRRTHRPHVTTSPTGTTVVTGPLGLLGVLQTRLGTARSAVNRPIRIAQYRSLMAEADHPWYRRSFATDPWNTAHHLLRLRDDAVEAGWQPSSETETYAEHPRIEALAAVERLVRLGPAHDSAASLAPGRADDLQEVLSLIRRHGPNWPLGIDTLELQDRLTDLPHTWQYIVEALLPGQKARLGIIRSTVLASLTSLFTALQNRGITLTDTEADFTHVWELRVNGSPRTVELGGMRDLEGTFDDGRPAIIDLKWSNSGKRYRTMIDEDEAVQLSVYSRTATASGDGNPLTACFLLKQGRFVCTDSALDPDFTGGADETDDGETDFGGDPAGLWPRRLSCRRCTSMGMCTSTVQWGRTAASP